MKQFLRYSFFSFLFLVSSLSIKGQAVDGYFYSLVYYGGALPYSNQGTINLFDPLDDSDTAVFNFAQATGWRPYGNFIQLSDGMLYGMTSYGGDGAGIGNYPGCGAIIRYNTQTGQETVLDTFPLSGNLGAFPYGSLCYATNDSLYGLTYTAGLYGQGTIFSVDYHHPGGLHLLSNMRARIVGSEPTGSLIQATNGILYGLTTNDTLSGNTGTIFSYDPATGNQVLLHIFQNVPDGYYPRGSLLQVNDSMLYGLTQNGGVNNLGCIFSFNINSSTEKVLYSFTGSPDGQNPEESLMLASDGNLYGTTAYGGTSDSGTIFQYIIASNTETPVYSFKGYPNDGANPYDDLIQANDHLLYGNTYMGGINYTGVIFSYNISTQVETVLRSYDSAVGQYPYGDFLEVMSAYTTVTSNVCANDTDGKIVIHVRGGKPVFTYTWSNGATTDSIYNLISGIYTCSVSDSRGITFDFTDTVKPLPMIVNFVVSNACSGDSNGSAIAVIQGGTAPFTYSWSNGQTTDTTSNLPQGSYTCAVIDGHGCTASGTVTITQAAPLVINSITATEESYSGNNGSIFISVSGGIPPGDTVCYHYLWSVSGYYTGYDTTTLLGLDSGYYSVCVTSCYCSGSVCDTGIYVATTGINNPNNPGNLVKVYPVPSSGLITLILNGDGFENLEITNALGLQVYKQTLSPELSNNTMHINLSTLSDGIYILQVNSRQGLLTRKIIIQK